MDVNPEEKFGNRRLSHLLSCYLDRWEGNSMDSGFELFLSERDYLRGNSMPTSEPANVASQEKSNRNEKGRDIGYALAANSCEGASSVDARTITAL
jgi:hypothetical protein